MTLLAQAQATTQCSHVNLSHSLQNINPSLGNNCSFSNFVLTLSTCHLGSTPWIIDLGHTYYHITCSLDCFEAYFKIKPIHIKLPNGASITSYYSGMLIYIIIHNVLLCS